MGVRTRKKSAPRFTLSEKESVLKETLRLLRKPESWTKNRWKCELPARDKRGRIVYKKTGIRRELVQAKDSKGRLLYQYCLEGAVNQAILNVLGEKRAIALGAYHPDQSSENYKFTGSEGSKYVSITELLDEMFPARGFGHDPASFNDWSQTKYEDVINLLKTRLNRIRQQIKKRAR